MTEIFIAVVALLAAVGVVTLVWLALGAIQRSDSAGGLPVAAVLRVSARSGDVQRTVRRLKWLNQWGTVDVRIILADDGITEETKKLVDLLLRNDPSIALCALPDVAESIARVGDGGVPDVPS